MFKVKHPPLKTKLVVSSAFGMRTYVNYWWHNGIDYACAIGTPVYAVADGTVQNAKDGGSYGNYIDIWHGDAGSLYAHLKSFVVKVGQQVKAGDLIGYSGVTGQVEGPHLHFELRLCSSYSNFWERCKLDSSVFMRCTDPAPFVNDCIRRLALTTETANALVVAEAALESNSENYLNYYKFSDDLIVSLGQAML